MEKVSDLEKKQKERNVSRIVKGSVFAILLTFVFLLLFSVMLTYTNISEKTITPVVIVITAISILIGSSISTKNINKNGILNGGMVGAIYIIFIYILSSIICSGFYLSLKSILMIISAIVAGMIGGIIGVNKKI